MDTVPIRTPDALDAALDRLVERDKALAALASRARPLPMRLAEPGFASFVRIIISQQVSAAVADVLFRRLEGLAGELTPQSWRSLGPDGWRAAGLSRPKQKTISAVAQEVEENALDLEAVCRLDAGQAIQALTAIWGVGPWTAEVYLLFAAGHPDVFPSRDLALQAAVRDLLNLPERPVPDELAAIAARWSPHRSVAARLLWAVHGLDRALPTPLPA
jgi:DNA-3-methyladenine glycosylase II